MLPPMPVLTGHARRLLASKRVWALLILLGMGVGYPFIGGTLMGRLVASKLTKRLGLPVEYHSSRAGWGTLHMKTLRIGPQSAPLLVVSEAEIPFAVAWGSGMVIFHGPKVTLVRSAENDPLQALLVNKPKTPARAVVGDAASYPSVQIVDGQMAYRDQRVGVAMTIQSIDGLLQPKRRFQCTLKGITGQVGGLDSGPSFGVESLTVEGLLDGMHLASLTELSVNEGYFNPLATLPLTGITGTLKPAKTQEMLDLFFSGSYRGAKRSLWTATGKIAQPMDFANPRGEVTIRAERFSLDKIADVLPPSILEPANTEVDAAITVKLEGRRMAIDGKLDVARLSVMHEKLASEPVQDASFSLRFSAAIDRDRRRFELAEFEGKMGALAVQVAGSIELAPGKFQFKNGESLDYIPHIELSLRVPRARCAKILASIPGPLVPQMQGFTLQGFFDADIRTHIKFDRLEALELSGRVGINGCQVQAAPVDVLALMGPESLQHTVEIPPEMGGGNTNELMTFLIGPDNPEFVPYEKISPFLVSAILTTEDSGFFKHRGWVTPEFKTALRRNIAGGGFRLGASSITMQMVKNVLLNREKTLSRKFQELFLAWYIEQLLPKERILELYFNAIEYGPRLYGIGPAARHYFGKSAADLLPVEAAFFSSILPSPKRRYVQYCKGSLTPQWERYVRRILSKMHERGRLNEEEYATAMASTLVFDKAERTFNEKQCTEWIKKIHRQPEPESEPDGN